MEIIISDFTDIYKFIEILNIFYENKLSTIFQVVIPDAKITLFPILFSKKKFLNINE